MISILFINSDELTREERNAFWDQNINMDDWDYMVLLPSDFPAQPKPNEYNMPLVTIEDYSVERLLRDNYKNRWYRGVFRGKEYVIGITYHS